jgi:hypothetical protein
LALPILFLVSFALLVNAKTKKLKRLIKRLLLQYKLKKDTIKKKVPVDSLVKFHQEK